MVTTSGSPNRNQLATTARDTQSARRARLGVPAAGFCHSVGINTSKGTTALLTTLVIQEKKRPTCTWGGKKKWPILAYHPECLTDASTALGLQAVGIGDSVSACSHPQESHVAITATLPETTFGQVIIYSLFDALFIRLLRAGDAPCSAAPSSSIRASWDHGRRRRALHLAPSRNV